MHQMLLPAQQAIPGTGRGLSPYRTLSVLNQAEGSDMTKNPSFNRAWGVKKKETRRAEKGLQGGDYGLLSVDMIDVRPH